MSGAFVTLDLEGLAPMLARLNGLGSPRRSAEGLANIGGLIESQTRERFETKVSPDGDAWAEWSETYALTRKSGQTLLMATGAYQDSYAWDLTGDALRVGSNMVQAALMNFGGTDDMASGPAAVPARQQLGLSADNIRDIEEAMGDWIEGLAQ